MSLKILLLLVANIVNAFSHDLDDVTVCLDGLGCLQGIHMPGYHCERFEAFLGVPFARPPLGDLRLSNPKPASPWAGVLQATATKADCLQKNYLEPTPVISGEEDCLYLNVYRPENRSTDGLPVMFYIHGGGFFSGSANPLRLGPEYFMDSQEVILVIPAYRLGPFGFLSTGDEHMPGNFGLKDQRLALQWVQQHIGAFGGDPAAVTIFGNSVGGSSVHFHLLSKGSEGLFKRAISMSGSALAPFVDVVAEPLEQAVALATAAGISQAANLSSEDLADALRTADPYALLQAGDVFKVWDINPLTNFRPVIEDADWPNAFLTSHPREAMREGAFSPTPWMMSLTSNRGEGVVLSLNIFENETLRRQMNEDFDGMLAVMMDFPKDTPSGIVEGVVNMVIDEYFHGIHELNEDTLNGFSEFFSDVAFYHPFYKTAEYFLNFTDVQLSPLFLFKFNYRGPYSYSSVYSGSQRNVGVVHADDTIYLFRSPYYFPYDFPKDSIDAEMVKEFVNFYVQFAKEGKPQQFNDIHICSASVFRAADDNDLICPYVEFANDDDVGFKIINTNTFNLKRMHFWDKILYN